MATADSTPDTIEIPLTKGYVALVSSCDGDLARFKWQATEGTSGLIYAQRDTSVNGKRVKYFMHRVILGRILGFAPAREQECDHINGDGLLNTRDNLRLATPSQNRRNQRVSRKNTSGVRGVSWYKAYEKWSAEICVNGTKHHLGYFLEFSDATAARHEAELKFFGEFSPLISRGQ